MKKQPLAIEDQAWYDEILCIADTKQVLAGWYMITLPNGRSIADWNAICGMMQDHYGHARALYGSLKDYGLTREDAEYNRGAKEIRSPEMLDTPPESWLDLIVASYLAERAIDTLLSAYEQDPRKGEPASAFAPLARKIGRETQFHLRYFSGWLKVLAVKQTPDLERIFLLRLERMLRWWGPHGMEDFLHTSGQRPMSRDQLREKYLAVIERELSGMGIRCNLPSQSIEGWRPRDMRATPHGLPEKLFELMRFKYTELAMP